MNVAMGVYGSAIVVVLLFGQVFSASLSAIVDNGQTQDKIVRLPSMLNEEPTTTMPIPTEYPLGSNEKKVHDHQAAIKWFKVYKYLPQEEGISCESCDPKECAEECLEVLQEIVVEPLKKFQEFYEFEPTGVLTDQDITQMNQPRCGDSDEKKGQENSRRQKRWAKLGSTVWPAELMPLKIKVHGGTKNFQISDVESIALECATLWAKPSSLWFQLASPQASKGNIDLRFEYIDGPWNTVGLGLSPVVWGDKSSYLKLDSHETWKRNAKTDGYGVSLKWAICHEMGHNLGLSHSNDRTAIMYPSGIGQNEDTLPRDDYTGITTLYRGQNGKTVVGRARPATPSQTARRVVTRAPVTRRPVARRPVTTRRPVTNRRPVTTRRPVVRRPVTTRRPVTRRTTQRTVWRPSPTRAPTPPPSRFNSRTTQYRHFKPNYPPHNHVPRYRPGSTPAPTPAPRTSRNYWYFNTATNQWIYG